jgi:hypothetical protein
MATQIASPDEIKKALNNFALGSLYNDQDPLMETYIQIANSYKTQKMSAGNFPANAVACQIARHVIYFKKVPGDCPLQSSYSFGPGAVVSKAGGFAALGASSVAAGATLAAGGTGAVAAGGTAAAGIATAAATAATVIGLAVLPFTVWAAFTAHHAAAVAKEQANICEIISAVNPSFDQLDAAVQAGQISAQAYIAALEQLRLQAKNALKNSGVYQNCNAACYIEGYLNCVCDIRKILYQQSSSVAGGGDAPSAKVVAGQLVQTNGIFGLALAGVAAKLTGVI